MQQMNELCATVAVLSLRNQNEQAQRRQQLRKQLQQEQLYVLSLRNQHKQAQRKAETRIRIEPASGVEESLEGRKTNQGGPGTPLV